MPKASRELTARRILIYGVTGSGKTTYAERLSAKTGIPWHSVDELTWEPNWTEVPLEIQRDRFEEICARDEWILDTAYAKWIDIPSGRVELIICLDYPRWVSLSRLLRRCTARVFDKNPVCNGNRETLRNTLSRNSIIGWHFKSFGRKRERMRNWEAQDEGPAILRFTSPSDADAWLFGLDAAQAVT